MRGHSHYLLHFDAMGVTIFILSKKKSSFAESTRHHPRDSILRNCVAQTMPLVQRNDLPITEDCFRPVDEIDARIFHPSPGGLRRTQAVRFMCRFFPDLSRHAKVIPSTICSQLLAPPAKGNGAGSVVESERVGQSYSSTRQSIHQSRRKMDGAAYIT